MFLMIDIRIFFEKSDKIKYISHLDLNRAFQRALKRAKLPVWHTEGFNPHLYLVFSNPLSVGYIGEREILDIRLNEDIPLEEVRNKLCSVLPDGIIIKEIIYPKNKIQEIKYSSFSAKFSYDVSPEKILSVLDSDELITEKKSKKGITNVNIKDLIKKYEIKNEGDEFIIDLIVDSSVNSSLNPRLIFGVINKELGINIDNIRYTRKEFLDGNFKSFK